MKTNSRPNLYTSALLSVVSCCVFATDVSAEVKLTLLDYRSVGDVYVSDDGSVVAGSTFGSPGIRWTAATGASSITPLPSGSVGHVTGLSGNGRVIIEWTGDETGIHAFRWSESEGVVFLAKPPTASVTFSQAISGDGSIIVGNSEPTVSAAAQVTRWDGTSAPQLLPGVADAINTLSNAEAISADGKILAGWSADAEGHQSAVRWEQDVPIALPTGLTSREVDFSSAFGISAGGDFVVGANFIEPEHRGEAFIWSKATGTVPLGLLDGMVQSIATDVTSDGSVVIGDAGGGGFIWTAKTGMMDFNAALTDAFGLGDILSELGNLIPTDISPDGRFIAGTGPIQPWLLDLGANPPPWGPALTPVPELSTFAWAASALVVLVSLRRGSTKRFEG